MKCWVIKKSLPLYVGEKDDLPFFHDIVSEHLEKCPDCKKECQRFHDSRNALNRLRTPILPVQIKKEYWEEIYREISSPPEAARPKVSLFFWPRFAMVCVLLIISLIAAAREFDLFGPFDSIGKAYLVPQATEVQKENGPISSDAAIHFLKFQEPQFEILLNNQREEKNKTEYELDEVKLLHTQNASF